MNKKTTEEKMLKMAENNAASLEDLTVLEKKNGISSMLLSYIISLDTFLENVCLVFEKHPEVIAGLNYYEAVKIFEKQKDNIADLAATLMRFNLIDTVVGSDE